jgi:hypothetical protein
VQCAGQLQFDWLVSRRLAGARSRRLPATRPGATASASIRARADAGAASGALCLSIAGISVAVTSGDPDLHLRFPGNLTRFSAPTSAPDVRIEAAWRDLTAECDGTLVFDSGGTWRLYATSDSYLFQFFAASLGTVPYQVARFDRDFRSGQVFLHRPFFGRRRMVNPLQYPLDELLIVHMLSRGKGVEVHACGLVEAGNGYLFAGHSGAGKTTMARLWEREPGITVLSDDRIVLRQIDGRFWMYGTPWHGEAGLAQSARAPLTQVFLLRHAAMNAVLPISGAEATARLFSCTFPTFHDRGGLEFTVGCCEGLVRTMPCAELGFVPDDRIVGVVRRHASGTLAPPTPGPVA